MCSVGTRRDHAPRFGSKTSARTPLRRRCSVPKTPEGADEYLREILQGEGSTRHNPAVGIPSARGFSRRRSSTGRTRSSSRHARARRPVTATSASSTPPRELLRVPYRASEPLEARREKPGELAALELPNRDREDRERVRLNCAGKTQLIRKGSYRGARASANTSRSAADSRLDRILHACRKDTANGVNTATGDAPRSSQNQGRRRPTDCGHTPFPRSAASDLHTRLHPGTTRQEGPSSLSPNRQDHGSDQT